MSAECSQLPLFVDGELSAKEAERFTRHLASCRRCPPALTEMLAMDDLVADGELSLSGLPVQLPLPPRPSRPGPGLRFRLALATGALALAGGAALLLVGPRAPRTDALLASLADTPHRTQLARLSHPAADRHRPFNPLRAAGSDTTAAPASLPALAAVERQGDARALVAVYFLMGMPAQAAAHLPSGDASADALSDRAALLIERGQPDGAAPLLEQALRLQPTHRQARWNRALVLRARGDRAGAARAFADLARDDGPGWAEEARALARDLLP
jgi:cellulose synthase operon protein C